MRKKRLPYPAAIGLTFLAVLLCICGVVFSVAAEPAAPAPAPPVDTAAASSADVSQRDIDLMSILQMMQGYMDSYKNDLSGQVSNHYDSLAILLAVASGVFGLFGVAVPLINYAYSREDKKEVQENLAKLAEANERTVELETRLNAAEAAFAAQMQKLDDANLRVEAISDEQQALQGRIEAALGQAEEKIVTVEKKHDKQIDELRELIGAQKTPEGEMSIGKNYVVLGNKALDDKKYDEAIAFYLQALGAYEVNDDHENMALTYSNMARAYWRQKKCGKSLEYSEKAIELDNKKAEYYHLRAMNLHEMGRFEDALLDREKTVELEPENARYYNQRGATLTDMKRYAEALSDRDKAIELEPGNALYIWQRGVTLHWMKRYDEALIEYNKAIEIDQTDGRCYSSRASVLYTLKRYEDALVDRKRSIELDPENQKYYESRALTYLALAKNTEDSTQKAEYERLAKQDEETAKKLRESDT